jgi:uncharacterized protein YjaZ
MEAAGAESDGGGGGTHELPDQTIRTTAGIPVWAGYSIGYPFVTARMARAPKLDLKTMAAAPASEFIPPSPK